MLRHKTRKMHLKRKPLSLFKGPNYNWSCIRLTTNHGNEKGHGGGVAFHAQLSSESAFDLVEAASKSRFSRNGSINIQDKETWPIL